MKITIDLLNASRCILGITYELLGEYEKDENDKPIAVVYNTITIGLLFVNIMFGFKAYTIEP